jgi:hypothetical protein
LTRVLAHVLATPESKRAPRPIAVQLKRGRNTSSAGAGAGAGASAGSNSDSDYDPREDEDEDTTVAAADDAEYEYALERAAPRRRMVEQAAAEVDSDPAAPFVVHLDTPVPPFMTELQHDVVQLYPQDVVARALDAALDARPRVLHDATDLRRYFAHLTPVGAGLYGVVAIGCVAAEGARANVCAPLRVRLPTTCELLAAEADVIAPVVVKFAWRPPGEGASGMSPTGHWEGNTNATREALFGRALSGLVRRRFTPHFMNLYSVLEVGGQYRTFLEVFDALGLGPGMDALRRQLGSETGILPQPVGSTLIVTAMEQCSMTLGAFVARVLAGHPRAVDLVRSAVVQVCAGLAGAQTQLDFRHNDLHAANVMAASTQELWFYYRVRGVTYRVPTYGVCWRIIDYGSGSSALLTDANDTACALAFHFGALEWGLMCGSNPDHALELYDLSRLLSCLKKTCTVAVGQPVSDALARMDAVLTAVSATRGATSLAGNAMDRVGKYMKTVRGRDVDSAAKRALIADFRQASDDRGLMCDVFREIAADFAYGVPLQAAVAVFELDQRRARAVAT